MNSTVVLHPGQTIMIAVLEDFAMMQALEVAGKGVTLYIEATDSQLAQISDVIGKHLTAKAEGKEKAAVK